METSDSSLPIAPSKSKEKRSFLGRYRVIMIAIGFFLLFDIGVLLVNFYTSFQMKDDAIGINLSGRQRMLSQRTTKNLLIVTNPELASEAARTELKEAAELFDSTLYGFRNGAIVTGGDGTPVFLKAPTTPMALDVLKKADEIWTQYYALMKPVIDDTATPQQQHDALMYGLANNSKLLGYMNDLTTDLEHTADNRASFLRMVQSIGILLALLNFVFILFKFIRQLRTADIAVEAANKENEEILDTVQEGLFLLTPDYRVGTQISASTNRLLGAQLKPGDDFLEMLSSRVSDKVLQDGAEYVKLLLSPHVKEALIKGINPLSDIEVLFENKLGTQEKHYLSFDFRRVKGVEDEIKHLLVTVQDITQRVALEEKLKEERKSSQKEFSTFLKAMDADPKELLSFIDSAEKTLFKINDILRTLSDIKSTNNTMAAIEDIARDMHAFKGNAAILNLDMLAEQAHQFETELNVIKSGALSPADLGEALLPLPISLGRLLNTVTLLKGLMNIGTHVASAAVPPTSPAKESISSLHEEEDFSDTVRNGWEKSSEAPAGQLAAIDPLDFEMLNRLTQNVATDTGKQVMLVVDNDSPWEVFSPETNQLIREISIQLLRNSVVHGIEIPENRRTAGKPVEGKIEITLEAAEKEKLWRLVVRDDGMGISPVRIRERLKQQGVIKADQLASMSDEDVIRQIFQPDFSTASTLSTHAGRGVGLNLVRSLIRRLPSGYLRVMTSPDNYTEFSVNFQS